MLLLKLYCHIIALFCRLYYKLAYGSRCQVGRNFQFRKGFTLLIDKDGDVRIGDDVFFNNYCTVCAMKEITIGNGTIFGENVKIYDHNHIYKNPNILIKKQGYTSGSIHIGNHCWIGSNVTILKGVKIGDNCVIGASCVVYRDVPTNSIVLNKQEQIIKVL